MLRHTIRQWRTAVDRRREPPWRKTERVAEVRLLVIHQNFPGQFGHQVQAWSQRPGSQGEPAPS
jgi:hypothetical protein